MPAMLIGDPRTIPSAVQTPLVLLVEDDARLAAFLDRELSTAGFCVERRDDGARGLIAFDSLAPDVLLVDLVLPSVGGLELARQVRSRSSIPILMLGSEHGVDHRIAGLDAGADDYVTKPFAIEELLARVRALLRGRALAAADALAGARQGILAYADVRLDQDTREAWRGERRLELRNKAFEL